MLTACRFSEFDTSAICHAVLTLFRLVSISSKISFRAQIIVSKGTKIKVFCENNAYFDSILQLAYVKTPGPDI